MENYPVFYRTSAGAEIDLVIEFDLDGYLAVEIKASRTPSLERASTIACEDLKPRHKLVVYTGEDRFPHLRQQDHSISGTLH
ncbi:MAG: hypothetical protein OXE41_04495 [Gammaproteobacteria bacterium]|nr:hypothetical protein [Gammaproteobacteria bacterium]MCY4219305.1 hypothetical protein [Gammaproteobacteria bacterium]MCY4274640.1 hypothetical protein [Gammaproteobacteria bacterium]